MINGDIELREASGCEIWAKYRPTMIPRISPDHESLSAMESKSFKSQILYELRRPIDLTGLIGM